MADVPRRHHDAAIAEQRRPTRGFLTRSDPGAPGSRRRGRRWTKGRGSRATPPDAAAARRRAGGSSSPTAAAASRAAPEAPCRRAGDRRCRQVITAWPNLRGLRDHPDLGCDLFAFLRLPTERHREMLDADREDRRGQPPPPGGGERSMTDDLLADGQAAARGPSC